MGSATTPTTVSTATMPTSMTDAEATRLGLKTYSHGTTYTGSPNSPTITLSSGGGTLGAVQEGDFIPYQMQDGHWRLKFNVAVTLSSTARTSVGLSVAGVVFFATGSAQHAFSAWVPATTTDRSATQNTGNLDVTLTSATIDRASFSGDLRLASKPTWAY